MLKMAVSRRSPAPSVSTTADAKTGLLRTCDRRLLSDVAGEGFQMGNVCISHRSSRTSVTLPNCRLAARVAASGAMPWRR